MKWSRVWRRWCNFWLACFDLIKHDYPENYVLRAVEDQIATLLFFFPQLRSSQTNPPLPADKQVDHSPLLIASF
jgi:hypothetical protein